MKKANGSSRGQWYSRLNATRDFRTKSKSLRLVDAGQEHVKDKKGHLILIKHRTYVSLGRVPCTKMTNRCSTS
jgi:hypothetical protein